MLGLTDQLGLAVRCDADKQTDQLGLAVRCDADKQTDQLGLAVRHSADKADRHQFESALALSL